MNKLWRLIARAEGNMVPSKEFDELRTYLVANCRLYADLIDAAKQVSDNLQEYTDQTDALLWPKAAAKLKSALAKLEAK